MKQLIDSFKKFVSIFDIPDVSLMMKIHGNENSSNLSYSMRPYQHNTMNIIPIQL